MLDAAEIRAMRRAELRTEARNRSYRPLAESPANGTDDGGGGNRTREPFLPFAAELPAKWGRAPSARRTSFDPDDFVTPEVGYRLAGFVDGEGCFFIDERGTRLVVCLRLDDLPLLKRLRAELGYPGRLNTDAERGARRPVALWTIGTRDGVDWLIDVFDRFPLWSKKQRDYQIWREATVAWRNGCSREELLAFRDRIRAVRLFPGETADREAA
jgi:hypothetical protein